MDLFQQPFGLAATTLQPGFDLGWFMHWPEALSPFQQASKPLLGFVLVSAHQTNKLCLLGSPSVSARDHQSQPMWLGFPRTDPQRTQLLLGFTRTHPRSAPCWTYVPAPFVAKKPTNLLLGLSQTHSLWPAP
ncbi:hypothetical protein ACFXTH_008666 [Malus domestica]